ncbi:50S ribosomal protein L9 [Pelagibacterales bacterium SAG-MED32]|nr:50S ribosomal protein L9 [Pelagibacterales bacterium SAG-MED32]|tara:strand:+ start:2254 stop:2700 length:447 start_codon:yes stop_codon:yes gene_type:complete
MDIILLESLNKLGKAGEIVTVKDGFARNFLIPEKKAIVANKKNKADLENRITQINANNDKKLDEANEFKEKLDGKKISIQMEANEDGSLYGAVSHKSVSDNIYTLFEIKISPDAVIIDPIKELGETEIQISLYADIKAKLHLEITKKT